MRIHLWSKQQIACIVLLFLGSKALSSETLCEIVEGGGSIQVIDTVRKGNIQDAIELARGVNASFPWRGQQITTLGHTAVREFNKELVDSLVNTYHFDCNLTDSEQKTPLQVALELRCGIYPFSQKKVSRKDKKALRDIIFFFLSKNVFLSFSELQPLDECANKKYQKYLGQFFDSKHDSSNRKPGYSLALDYHSSSSSSTSEIGRDRGASDEVFVLDVSHLQEIDVSDFNEKKDIDVKKFLDRLTPDQLKGFITQEESQVTRIPHFLINRCDLFQEYICAVIMQELDLQEYLCLKDSRGRSILTRAIEEYVKCEKKKQKKELGKVCFCLVQQLDQANRVLSQEYIQQVSNSDGDKMKTALDKLKKETR